MNNFFYNSNNAKRFFLLNVISNISVSGVNVITNLMLTHYIIVKLGLAAFGVFSLINSLVPYFKIYAMSINTSVSRFVIINIQKKKINKANNYLYSSLFGLSLISVILLPVFILLIYYGPYWLKIDSEQYLNFRLLGGLILIGAYFEYAGAIIRASYVAVHLFWIPNFILVLLRIILFSVLISLFYFDYKYLWFVGLYQVLFFILCLILFQVIMIRMQNEIDIFKGKFKFQLFKNISKLGLWELLICIANYLFLSGFQLFITKKFGIEMNGKFAIVTLFLTMMLIFPALIATIMNPILCELIVKKKYKKLIKDCFVTIYFIIIIIELPLLAIFINTPLLIDLYAHIRDQVIIDSVRIMVISLFIGNILFLPFFYTFRGFNKLQLLAIFNITAGALHLVVIYLGFNYFDLSVKLVAYSYMILFGFGGLFINIFNFKKVLNHSMLLTLKKLSMPLTPLFLTLLCVGLIFTGDDYSYSYNIMKFLTALVLIGVFNMIFLFRNSYIRVALKIIKNYFLKFTKK